MDNIHKYFDFVHEIENREDLEPEVKESIAELPQTAVRPLIREKDPEIKENVIKKIGETVKNPEPKQTIKQDK